MQNPPGGNDGGYGGYAPPPAGGSGYGNYGPPPGALPPGSPYGAPPGFGPPQGELSDKSKMAAGLMQILIGGLGIGRFYLGYTGIGIAQLCVTLFTCGAGSIWTLIDGIMILMGNVPDAQGRKLRD